MPPNLRTALVSEARSWLGTPFVHRGRVKGVGIDCIGLVLMSAAAVKLGIDGLDGEVAAYLERYPPLPDGRRLRRGCDQALRRIGVAAWGPGDVLLFKERAFPMHLGIAASRHGAATLIHATPHAGACVEHRLDAAMTARLIGAYRFKGIETWPSSS